MLLFIHKSKIHKNYVLITMRDQSDKIEEFACLGGLSGEA